jgi:hypothetical protein
MVSTFSCDSWLLVLRVGLLISEIGALAWQLAARRRWSVAGCRGRRGSVRPHGEEGRMAVDQIMGGPD